MSMRPIDSHGLPIDLNRDLNYQYPYVDLYIISYCLKHKQVSFLVIEEQILPNDFV